MEISKDEKKALFILSTFEIESRMRKVCIPAVISGRSRKHGEWNQNILEFNLKNIFPEVRNPGAVIDSLIEKGLIRIRDDDVAVSYRSSYYELTGEVPDNLRKELEILGKEFVNRLLLASTEFPELVDLSIRTLKHDIDYEKTNDAFDRLCKNGLAIFAYRVYTGRYPYIYFVPQTRICPAASGLVMDKCSEEIPNILGTIGSQEGVDFRTILKKLGERQQEMVLICFGLLAERPESTYVINEEFEKLVYRLFKTRHRITDNEMEKIYNTLKKGEIDQIDENYSFFLLNDLRLMGIIKENQVKQNVLERFFAPLRKKWLITKELLEYALMEYIDAFPDEWKENLRKSVKYMLEGDEEAAFMYLANIMEKFSDELSDKRGKPSKKFNRFVESCIKRIQADINLESERGKVKLNVEKLGGFIKNYLEKTREMSSLLKWIRNIAYHKSAFFEFYTDQYLATFLMLCVIGRILKEWGWSWYE